MMICHWLTVLSVCRTICSDPGLQFTDGSFKALCSLLRIRHAKSVTYLSRFNGRAELAQMLLFEKLRKIHLTNKRRNWSEEMWPITTRQLRLACHLTRFSLAVTPWVSGTSLVR